MVLLNARNLTKSYKDKKVVDSLSLTVNSGEILGLVGPNGAGKTTTIRMITTILPADSGSVEICGYDIRKKPKIARQNFSLIPQGGMLNFQLNVFNNIYTNAMVRYATFREARIATERMLNELQIKEFANKYPQELSGGMRRKVQLARLFVSPVPLYILDEPTTGLDPVAKRQIWNIIHDKVASGSSFLITTQSLEEAEALCNKIIFIKNGKVVLDGPTRSILNNQKKYSYKIVLDRTVEQNIIDLLTQIDSKVTISCSGSGILLGGSITNIILIKILTCFEQYSYSIISISREEISLEDVYMALMEND
jgi:ABC-type multidrug transport system ATPase subunit